MIPAIQRPFRVLFSPRSVFEAIRTDLRWEWLVALVVLAAVGVGVGSLLYPKIEMEDYIRDQIERSNASIPESELEHAVQLQEKVTGIMIRYLQPLVIAPIAYLVIALLMWVGMKLAGGELRYGTAFTVVVHSLMPWVVASLLWLPVILSRESIPFESVETGGILASNLGWLAPADAARPLKTLLASVDVFSIWTVWLMSLGLAITAGVHRSKSTTVAVTLWVAWILIKVGLTALGGLVGG